MTEAIIEAELLAACSTLGYSDGQKYVRDPDCLETVRDLLRYLRRDDAGHEIRLALGDTKVVQNDLIPILREHSKDRTLLDLVLRLLVNLTSPALLVFHQEIPEEKLLHQKYLRLVAQQQGFKEAFTDGGVWASIAAILGEGLQEEGGRDDNTNLLVEMCLVLLRNVLAVAPGRQDSTRTHDDADLHDQVLWSLHLAGIPDLLLYLASSQHEQELALHTLEIISLMLRQQDPQCLATSALHRSTEEKKKDDSDLVRLREAERARRHQQTRKHYNARHPRFGGTYCVQNMKSISERDIIAHRPIADISAINFDNNKRGKKIPKNRAPINDSTSTRRSTLAIRMFLQEFCIEFLNGAYNNLMYIVKDNLNRARTQEHDETYYLWSIKFFMEFNRHHEFKVELVSETLSIQIVHFVQTNIENYYEMMTTEKKKIPLWSRRMHNGLKAYQEILMTLAAMDKSTDDSVRSSSLTLKSKIFYVVEYRELPLILLQNYDQSKMSKSYLKDLVEMTHIFLKLLEGMCKKTKHLMVQQQGKKKSGQKKKKTRVVKEGPPSPEKLEEMWSLLASELSAIIEGQGEELPVVMPFDPLSESSEEEQKEAAMRKVNALLRKRELAEAVALFRASREVWPEGDVFGAQDIESSEEFSCLRDVFMAELNPIEQQEDQDEEDEETALAEESEMENASVRFSEKELEFSTLIRRFANIKILPAYTILLKSYATNTAYTNRCIIKLFHRIAWDSKMPAVFFQSSLFIIFHKVMTDPARKTDEMIGEIAKFAKYIVRQFFQVAETNQKVFFEVLFWKNSKEALDIECGYDTPVQSKAMKSVWSEEEDNEIIKLFEEFQHRELDPDDDTDLADYVLKNLIRQDRTRRMVIKKLKDMDLISNLKDIKKKVNRFKQWTETEEDELRVLFEEHIHSMDPMARILDFMVHPKPKNAIINKLLELGLINDKSEVKKKRVPKPKQQSSKTKNDGERFLAANDSSSNDEDSDSNDESETTIQSQNNNKKNKRLSKPPVQVTPYLVATALKTVIGNNMQSGVQWLAESLDEVANDREEDGDFQPIPILAFTEEQNKALEDDNFVSLMKIIGLQPPQSHEEMFWRVPSTLTIEGLRKRADYMKQGLEGTLPEAPDTSASQNDSQIVSSVESPKIKSKRAKKSKVKERDVQDTLEEDNNIENEVIRDDSDKENEAAGDDDSDNEPLFKTTTATPLTQKNKRPHSVASDSPTQGSNKKRRIILEDSEDDEDELPAIQTENLKLQLKTESADLSDFNGSRARIIDSDDESSEEADTLGESKKKPSKIDSDDGDDEPVVKRSRTAAIIDSDDDD